jgi:ubiquinone/menaquinone biosynthesis C-methylase UbiE
MSTREHQPSVSDYFARQSTFWRDIYGGDDVYSLVHRERMALVLSWMDELDVPGDSRVLDLGCGAGRTSVQLAGRGLRVSATDAVPEMVELTREHAAAAGVADRVEARQSDAHELGFEDETFDAVLAMGVIPWLRSPALALREMARVLRAGGVLIVTCDNAERLHHVVDPVWNPRLAPLRSAIGRLVPASRRPGNRGVRAHLHALDEFDRLVSAAGLIRERGKTFGFGPFTLLNRQVLPDQIGVRLHHRLQRAADRGVAGLDHRGAQYIVLARKP